MKNELLNLISVTYESIPQTKGSDEASAVVPLTTYCLHTSLEQKNNGCYKETK